MSTATLEPAIAGKHVRISNLSKFFDDQPAVDRVSMDIPAGTFCTILGASGSGKSTLLKMVAGYEQPSEGRIEIAGRDVASIGAAKRNIGMVFQNYALFPHMTVDANLSFPLEMRGVARATIKKRVEETLGMIGLAGFADRLPRQLSGGQQQRVALGRALIFNPDILLMDEPLGALDKNMRQAMQREIKAIHRQVGVTVLYVTHDQDEAMSLADLVVVMDRGVIARIGSPFEIYNAPGSDFVATFLGDCNLLEIDQASGVAMLQIGEGIPLPAFADTYGDATVIGIRPERIKVAEAPLAEDIGFKGIVIETHFNGSHYDIVVSVTGRSLRARLPNNGAAPPSPGGTAFLGCGFDDLVPLRVSGKTAG